MSFTSDVKKELIRHFTKNSHCQKAELAAIFLFSGRWENDVPVLVLEDDDLAKKCTSAFRKCFHLEVSEDHSADRKRYVTLSIPESKEQDKLGGYIEMFRVSSSSGEEEMASVLQSIPEDLLQKNCCRRAFLRGAFIASGMISNPEKNYHYEIKCSSRATASFLTDLAAGFGISMRIAKRREKIIAYVKDSVEIADMLNVMEAHVALMEFENIRIVREMRGNVNRKVNCETANIEKTVNASMKQIDDITLIRDSIGLEQLDEGLRQIAAARLENPDIPLSRLGELLSPPIGKSGVNHRFRKITRIAEQIRSGEQQ